MTILPPNFELLDPATIPNAAQVLVPMVEGSTSRAADADFRPAAFERIAEGCSFLRHCRDHAAGLSEPEWYAMLSIVARCDGGEQLCHELSKGYPGYDPGETAAKIAQALERSGPRTCARIRDAMGHDGCKGCSFGKLSDWKSAPTVLGRPPAKAHDFDDAGEPTSAEAAAALDDLVGPGDGEPAADAGAEANAAEAKRAAQLPRADLPALCVSDVQLRDLSDGALGALTPPVDEARRGVGIYIRTARLARVQADEYGHHRVQVLELAHLRGLLSRRANFYELTSRGNRIGCSPPKVLVEDLLARGDWSFPALDGVVETPCLRPDGTVLGTPGYDPATRLVYAPARGLVVPDVPERPTQAQAQAAARLLFEPFYDFPFETDSDAAGVLALLLTVAMRPAIAGKVPLCLVDAPKQGTGKSLLAEVVSLIATGHAVPVSTLPTRGEEWRKWITANLVAGRQMIQLDNLVGTLHSPELAAVLTADTWSDRLLGANDRTVTVANRAVWVATGNNLKVAGDMPRRCYRVRVDARTRDPQARQGWRHDPLVPWVREHRGQLLAAALTVARAWYAAGSPRAAAETRLGSFEEWTAILGGVLAFAGVPGFLANLDAFREEADDEGQQLEAWMLALQARFQAEPFRAADVAGALTGGDAADPVRELAPAWLALGGGELGKRLGRLLASVVGQVFGAWRLTRHAGRGGILRFAFVAAGDGRPADLSLKTPLDPDSGPIGGGCDIKTSSQVLASTGRGGFGGACETKPTTKPTPEVLVSTDTGGFGGFGGLNGEVAYARTPAPAHGRAHARAGGLAAEQTHQATKPTQGVEAALGGSPVAETGIPGSAAPAPLVVLDVETRSEVDLRAAGAWAYARHPSTALLCLVADIGGRVVAWVPELVEDLTGVDARQAIAEVEPDVELYVGAACPPPLAAALEQGAQVVAHNAEFEAAVWQHVAVERMGWPGPFPGAWRDSMALAAASALPQSLDGACAAAGVPGKLPDGKALIAALCLTTPGGAPATPTVDQLARLVAYNVQDVRATRDLRTAVGPELAADEPAVWQAHLATNRRGIAVDLGLADAMERMHDRLVDAAGEEAFEATGGAIAPADLTRVEFLGQWLAGQGFQLGDLSAESVALALRGAEAIEHEAAIAVLRGRRAVSRSSLAKLDALRSGVCDDGRLRGMLWYHKAGPGRWAGRGFQPHNLPRPHQDVDVEAATAAVLAGDLDALARSIRRPKDGSRSTATPMDALVACLRGVLVAAPGKVLVACDYAQIEARGVSWLAEDEKHLAWFRAGLNPYCEFGAKVFGHPINKKDFPAKYQVAKNATLGCGYQMGADRFTEYAVTNGADLGAAGTTAEAVIAAYRAEFEALSDYEYGLWYRMGDGAVQAVKERVAVRIGKHLRFVPRGRSLLLELPSGRAIVYPHARAEWDATFKRDQVVYQDYGRLVTGQPERTYGGKLTENATQAVCRDLLARALVRAEERFGATVLHVHDEIVVEVDEARGEDVLVHLEALMSDVPTWAEGFPVAAEGWVGRRYRK